MKIVKRMSVLILIMALAVSVVAVPASATSVSATYADFPVSPFYKQHFSRFPGVWKSNQYSVATVAVQKFLMLAGDSYAKKLMPIGGADGFCGGKTVECIKTFQERERLHTSADAAYGRVDQVTWERIADWLRMETVYAGDNEIVFFRRGNKSYYAELDDVENQKVMRYFASYYAMNHKKQWSEVPFYSPS